MIRGRYNKKSERLFVSTENGEHGDNGKWAESGYILRQPIFYFLLPLWLYGRKLFSANHFSDVRGYKTKKASLGCLPSH
jgi:hypothetical protein